MRKVRSVEENLKSTPSRMLTVIGNLPSFTSWICAVSPRRTVNCAGRRTITVSPIL